MEATKKQASYKPEMDSQIPKANFRLPKGQHRGSDKSGDCTLRYMKQTRTKDFLCDTGNCAQYTVRTCKGKNLEKNTHTHTHTHTHV